MRTLLAVACILVLWSAFANAQSKPRLLILPYKVTGIDSATARSAVDLIRRGVDQQDRFNLISGSEASSQVCQDLPCAVREAKGANAELVMYGGITTLGTKIVVDYTLVEVESSRRLLIGDATADSPEDLHSTIKEVVRRLVDYSTPGRAGTSSDGGMRGNVVLNAPKYTSVIGVSFGQLYATSGYDEFDRAFVLDSRISFEYPNYAFNVMGAWRLGPMVNLGASYLFTEGEITPYAGGGVGYAFLFLDEYDDDPFEPGPGSSRSGFQLMLSGGLIFMRNSDIRFTLNGDYMITASGQGDKAFVLTLGIAGSSSDIRF